jgi:transcription initiation factor TFIIH subunit 4
VQQITSVGFQFLLHPPGTQLWDLLLSYLNMAQERDMDLVEVVTFLCTLATMELGKEYTTQKFSQTQAVMLEDLMEYGLIWMVNVGILCFCTHQFIGIMPFQ